MKKIENSFAVTGFIGKDAELRSFGTASMARFSIAVSRADKTGGEISYVSAFMVARQLDAAMRFPGRFFHRQTGTGEQCSPLQEFFDSLTLFTNNV